MREQIDQTIVVEQLGVSAQDPFTIAMGLATLRLVAALASLLPARRATTVEPTTALRCEWGSLPFFWILRDISVNRRAVFGDSIAGMEHDARRARDAWIACRCQLGEPEAFEMLVAEMERPLFYFVLKLLGDEDAALDVLQEVWFKVFRTIGKLRAPEALRAWLYKVARGTALNRVREAASRSDSEEPLGDAPDAAFDGAGEGPGVGPDQAFEVHEALDRLDRRHREVLVLLFLEGLSVDEIAAVVAVPPGTVKSRIYHAKRALRALLGLRS